jgi:phosphoribosylformylglycinamidine synthase
MDVKAPGNPLYIVGETFKELGGSEYYKLRGHMGRTVPKVHAAQARKAFSAVTKAIDLGLVKACHDLSEGGLAVTAAEMALAGGYGVELDLKEVPSRAVNRNDFVLFSESNSRFLLEVPEKAKSDFEAVMKGKVCAEIGKVAKNPRLIVYGLDGAGAVDASLTDLRGSWKETLSREA